MEETPKHGTGGSEEARRHARNHPDEYPDELRMGLQVALEAVEARQEDNYDNPMWEPVKGFLKAAIDGTYPGG